MLGDGHIAKRSLTGNCRLTYRQSNRDDRRPYFFHVFSFFIEFCTQLYTPLISKSGLATSGKPLYAISFSTMALPIFNVVHSLFYIDKTKIAPLNIYELLTPIGLAFWIMDDGSRQNKGLHLSVYGYDSESVDRLLNVLQNKFNLKCTIHKHTSGPRIYIWEESMDNLRQLVRPFIIESMTYKIGE
jgi:hypothetical protein